MAYDPNATDLPSKSVSPRDARDGAQTFRSSTADALQAAFDKTGGVNSEAGYPSRELGTDPIIGGPGSHQYLRGNQHDDSGDHIWVAQSDVVQAGMLPKAESAPVGAPNKINPAGYPEQSLEP